MIGEWTSNHLRQGEEELQIAFTYAFMSAQNCIFCYGVQRLTFCLSQNGISAESIQPQCNQHFVMPELQLPYFSLFNHCLIALVTTGERSCSYYAALVAPEGTPLGT